MSRNLINLVAAAVTFGGATLLARPAEATVVSECTEQQWQAAQDAANTACAGASFSISCRPNMVIVTIVYCPPVGP